MAKQEKNQAEQSADDAKKFAEAGSPPPNGKHIEIGVMLRMRAMPLWLTRSGDWTKDAPYAKVFRSADEIPADYNGENLPNFHVVPVYAVL